MSWEPDGEQNVWLISEGENRRINLVAGKLKRRLRSNKELEGRQKTSGNDWEKGHEEWGKSSHDTRMWEKLNAGAWRRWW